MIGLDTNVVVRYLTQDDPDQSPRASALIEERLTEAEPGFVSLVAVVETAWVLRRAYRYSRDDVADEIERLLQIESLVVDREPEVFFAMKLSRAEAIDFSDALLGALNGGAGCQATLTFDRKALRVPGFEPA